MNNIINNSIIITKNRIININFDIITNIINAYFQILIFKHNIQYIISKPYYNITNIKLNITLYYYINTKNPINYKHFTKLSNILSKIINKEVNITIIRINYPYINCCIFAKYLSFNSNTNNYLKFQESIITNLDFISTDNILISYICGIKIIISGRIITERIIPRITNKVFNFGTFKGNNLIIDSYKHTITNKRGTFTIIVIISQSKKN